jgi:TRAP transporter TAXI family solute receptor
MKKSITFLTLLAFVLGINVSQSQIRVLTGSEHGTYIELANDMNKLLPYESKLENNDTVQVPFLKVKGTAGSSVNFDLIIGPNEDDKVAFMQLDVLFSKRMEDVLNDTKYTDKLMILMPLNVEAIHLFTKGKSGISSLATAAGKTIGIGNNLEGTYATAMYIQTVSKVNWRNRNISTHEALKALLLDKIDAFFIVSTPPMDMLKVLPMNTGTKFKLASIENINGWADYYTPMTIPAGTYNWQKTDVSTYGVPSVIVVNMDKVNDEEKQLLLQWRANTIQNLENLKANGHPTWKTATISEWDSSIWPQM